MQTQVEVERNDLWTSSATNQLPPPHPNCYCFALPEARSWNEHRRHSSNESCWTRAIAVNVRVGKIYEGSDHQEPFVHSFIHLSIHPFIHSAIQPFSYSAICPFGWMAIACSFLRKILLPEKSWETHRTRSKQLQIAIGTQRKIYIFKSTSVLQSFKLYLVK